MRNLKRTLSLLLAAAMLIGMMVVGASAANNVYDNFSDKDEIVNKDAVNLLTILEIMNGTEDGSQFEPTRPVDRAMMAKMIAVILNKGQDNSALYVGMNSNLTDVKGTWAEGYINFCVAQGIIAGRGDGRFDPTATVTASEAAKMLLVAAGYDADIEGYVGANWAFNANARAASLGIFDGYNGGVMDALSRDDAALLIANALDIEMIQGYSSNNYAQIYGDQRTILSAMYGVYKLDGVVVGNKWAELDSGHDVNDALKDGKTRVNDWLIYESNTLNTTTGSASSNIGTVANTVEGVTFNVDTPVDYLGERVTMYIRKTTVLTDSEVLGVFHKDNVNDVLAGTESKVSTAKLLEKESMKTDADTQYYVNYGYCGSGSAGDSAAAAKLEEYGKGITYKVIDNNNDGYADYVLYLKEDLAVVSSASNGNVAMYNYDDGINGVNKNVVTPVNRADGEKLDLSLEAGDVVLAITYGSRTYISEPEIVTGLMTAYNSNKLDEETIDVDGVTYNPSAIGQLTKDETSANGQDNILDLDVNLCESDIGVQFKTTYEFFLDTCGNIRAFRPTEESLPNYALILESGYNPGVYSSDASGKVTVLLADGTKDTFELNFSASAANLASQMNHDANGNVLFTGSDKTNFGIIELKGFLGTDYTDNSTTRPWRYGCAETGAAPANFIFAYQNSDTTVNTTEILQAKDYKAGRAAGYVISYTLNTDNVLTIKNVIGSAQDGAVAAGNWNNNNYSDSTLVKNNINHTLRTYEDALAAGGYSNGSATVQGENGKVAVDRNTVAFYYEDNDGEVKYDVRVGYDKMTNVVAGTNFVASTVVSTSYTTTNGDKVVQYHNTNLADAIVFNVCPTESARDYAYVLSANVTTSDDVTLNVIFENGEAGTLKLKKDHYENNFTDSSCFETIWAYSIGSNGYATVEAGNPVIGNGYRLKVGTVAVTSNGTKAAAERYYAYDLNSVKIWNVSNAKKGQDGVAVSDFTRVYDKQGQGDWALYLVIVNDEVRTAFIKETAFKVGGSVTAPVFNWNNKNMLNDSYKDWSNARTTAEIQTALNEGSDVYITGNYVLRSDLTVPAGSILIFGGALDANGKTISGNGKLAVNGNLTNADDLTVANVIVDGNWALTANKTISGAVKVTGNLTAENTSGTDYNVTIASGAWVSVTGAVKDINDLTVIGHLDAGSVTVSGDIIVTSTDSLIVNGSITANSLTVGNGSQAGKVEATNITVKDLTINNVDEDADNFTATKVIVEDGTVAVKDDVVTIDALELKGDVTVKTDIAVTELTVDASASVVLAAGTTLTVEEVDGAALNKISTEEGEAATIVIVQEDADDVTFTVETTDEGTTTITPDGDVEGVTVDLSVSATVNANSGNSAYVTGADADPVSTITFGDSADTETVTLTGTSTGSDAGTVTSAYDDVTDGAATLTLVKAEGTTTKITFTATAEGKVDKTVTITVVNGKVGTTPSTDGE